MSRKSRKNNSMEKLSIPLYRIRRAGLYVRLSNLNAGRSDDDSIETQTEYLKQYMSKYPDVIVEDIYADNGFTGRNFDRPQFERLLSDIRAKRIDCVVVKDFSRLGRNFVETGYYIEKLFPFLDIRFIAINDSYDSEDPQSRGSLAVPVKDMLNEYYSKDISRKVKGTFETKRQNGENIHVVPFGYKKDTMNQSKLVVDEETADFVRMIFEAYADGQSISNIANTLNEHKAILPYWRRKQLGLTRPSEKVKRSHWITTDVAQILENPVYTGDMVYNRLSYPNGYKKTPILNPKSEWRVVKDAHPAIISRTLYAHAEKKMAEYHSLWKLRKEEQSHRMMQSPNIFKGILFCAHCGKGMSVRIKQFGTDRTYQHFCCVDPKCKNRVRIAERLLRIWIMDDVREKKYTLEASVPAIDISQLEKQITDCKDGKRVLYEQMLDGKISREEYLEEKERLNQTENELERQIEENTERENVAKVDELCFSEELLAQLIIRIEVVSEREIKITYRSEVSK